MVSQKRSSSPQALHQQVDQFIDSLKSYNAQTKFPRAEKDYSFLRDFYIRFFDDRNKRALEVSSPEYKKVRELANAQFAAVTLWNLCMDGRVLAVLTNGASAGVGSSIRVPGGLLHEFVYGENGKLFLLEQSNFAFILKRALQKFKTKKVFEVYDSHIACAARKAEEMAHGRLPQDAGLIVDVLYKKQMAEATIEFVNKHFDSDIKVVPIQTSFDPHLGFLYMGLETDKALAYAKEQGGEYTDEVITQMVAKKLILSSEELIHTLRLEKTFTDFAFSLDWKGKYLESAKTFWTNIEAMKGKVLPLIEKEVLKVYPHLAAQDTGAQDELLERSMLLLTNAYSGFLNNNMQSKAHAEVLVEEHYHYPYGVHREEGVKVSEGGYPPYDISMFVLFSLDIKNLPSNIELAASLVRANRRDQRITDRSGTYNDAQEFAEAPVPLVVQEIIRESIDTTEWESLAKVDWSDLPHNWDTMGSQDFYEYLQKKANMSIAVANGINRLREHMAVLYDPEQPTSGHLIQHFKVAMPVIVGSNRRNYFVVPFAKLGFTE